MSSALKKNNKKTFFFVFFYLSFILVCLWLCLFCFCCSQPTPINLISFFLGVFIYFFFFHWSLSFLGKLQTTAQWTRDFVTKHPEYKQDSVVSDAITYDLLKRMTEISSGKVKEPSLLFDHDTKSSDIVNQAVSKAEEFINKRSPPSSHTNQAKNTNSLANVAEVNGSDSKDDSLSPS